MKRDEHCISCTKHAKVCTETTQDGSLSMCAHCPHLEALFSCLADDALEDSTRIAMEQSLTCQACHTSLFALKQGSSIGCSACITLFGNLLLDTLLPQDQSASLQLLEEPKPSWTPASRAELSYLQEQLQEALQQEQYERAAFLRDQMNQLQKQFHLLHYN